VTGSGSVEPQMIRVITDKKTSAIVLDFPERSMAFHLMLLF
jgi:hypothetical protein